MSVITKRRLAGLASASAVLATVAIAAAPAATMAATPHVTVRGTDLTAKIVNPTKPVTGKIDATGYDVAVYFSPGHSGSVKGAEITGAAWYGVVADRANVTVTGSTIHDIGDSPLDGTQHGNPIFYYDGARGIISDNTVFNFQKNGITVSGKAADGTTPSNVKTTATVAGNVVTGEGHIDFIAQNGIQVSYGADAVVKGNTVRGFYYTPTDNEATGLLSYEAGTVAVAGNRFAGNEINIYGPVKTIRDVRGTSTVTLRPHGVHIDFRSEKQPANTVMGKQLHWVVKVDGRQVKAFTQGFGKLNTFDRTFAAGSHRVIVIKNGVIARNFVVKA
jgi:nitrous oxidase accessory protein NosD